MPSYRLQVSKLEPDQFSKIAGPTTWTAANAFEAAATFVQAQPRGLYEVQWTRLDDELHGSMRLESQGTRRPATSDERLKEIIAAFDDRCAREGEEVAGQWLDRELSTLDHRGGPLRIGARR